MKASSMMAGELLSAIGKIWIPFVLGPLNQYTLRQNKKANQHGIDITTVQSQK
jgi:hypothetical protein